MGKTKLRPLHWLLLGALLVTPAVIGSVASVLAVLLAVPLLVVAVRSGEWRTAFAEPGIAVFVGVFGVLLALFAITARTPGDVLFAANFLALALAPGLYLLARNSDPAHGLRVVSWLCLAGAILGASIAVVDVHVLGEQRAAGLIGGPNLISRVVVLLGFLSMLGLPLGSGWRQLLFHAGPAAALVVVMLTGSRGAAIAIPPLAVLAGLLLFVGRGTCRQVPVLIGTMVLVSLGLLATSSPYLVQRMTGIGEVTAQVLTSGGSQDGATDERIDIAEVGITAFWKSPIVGHGWANLDEVAQEIAPGGPDWYLSGMFSYHNDALNFAVAGGFIGLLCWLALLVAPLLGPLQWPVPTGSPAAGLLCARLMLVGSTGLFGLTDMVLGYDLPTTLYVFIAALLLGWTRALKA